jgi:N-acetylmuramoyl-L-alanine amidase
LGREDNTTDIYEVTADNINLRKDAGKEYDSLGQIHKDTKVEFIKSENGWFFVCVLEKPKPKAEVKYGWIYSQFLVKKINL